MERTARTRSLIAIGVILLLMVPLLRFAWAERGYLKEVRLMMDSEKFWTGPVTHPGPDSEALGPYYLSLQGPYALRYGYEKWEVSPLEESRVLPEEDIVLDRPWSAPLVGYSDGRHVNPITVAQIGLADHVRYLATGDERFMEASKAAADWLVEAQTDEGAWRHDFPHRDLQPGWISAMAQGQAASLLTRVYQHTAEEAYLRSARDGIELMLEPIDHGGTLGKLPDASPYLEEYAGSSRIPHVLNGALFALFGLYDYAYVTADDQKMDAFRELSVAVADNLDLWDTGSWTRYALSDEYDMSTVPYHLVHIAQARTMYDLTGSRVWSSRADRWQGYLDSARSRGTFAYARREFVHRIKTRVLYSSWWPWSPLEQ